MKRCATATSTRSWQLSITPPLIGLRWGGHWDSCYAGTSSSLSKWQQKSNWFSLMLFEASDKIRLKKDQITRRKKIYHLQITENAFLRPLGVKNERCLIIMLWNLPVLFWPSSVVVYEKDCPEILSFVSFLKSTFWLDLDY